MFGFAVLQELSIFWQNATKCGLKFEKWFIFATFTFTPLYFKQLSKAEQVFLPAAYKWEESNEGQRCNLW